MDLPGSPLAKASAKETSGRSCLFPLISPTTGVYLYSQQGPQFHTGGRGPGPHGGSSVPSSVAELLPPSGLSILGSRTGGGQSAVWAHLSQPGMFSGCWLFQGIAKPCHSAPSSLSWLAPPGEKRREGDARGQGPQCWGWGAFVKYQPPLTDGEKQAGRRKVM